MVNNSRPSNPDFDIVISGGGCAGLSLAWHLYRHGPADQRILLIDPEQSDENPRTWCYWNQPAVPFHHLRRKSWNHISVHTADQNLSCKVGSIPGYHAIDSSRYREWIYEDIAAHPYLKISHTRTRHWQESAEQVKITTDEGEISAGMLFQNHHVNSDPYKTSRFGIRQHFIGWEIETDRETFDPKSATFMDFRVDQTHGLAFMYVLPWSAQTALFEFTFFTPAVLDNEVYEKGIRTYLKDHYNLDDSDYRINRREQGVIPMIENLYSGGSKRVRPIGVISGAAKPSSGYAFTRIQKQCRFYADQLKTKPLPDFYPPSARRFRTYDHILLRIIRNNPEIAIKAFENLFSKIPTSRLLHFLDEETKPSEELRILNSVPRLRFLKAGIQELLRV